MCIRDRGLPRHELARVANEQLEHLPLGGGESHLHGPTTRSVGHDPRREIDRDLPERHDRARLLLGNAPGERANAREQLFDEKRLRDVVVGTGIERLDLVAGSGAPRHDENRCV